ncbi:MAG: RagB/SusD family nutrient uptake outer membrane protein, partial [Chitinophagaceae bacterium]
MKRKISNYLCELMISLCIFGCKKSAFLGVKPNQALVVPSSIADYQALLDNDQIMNGAGNFGNVPELGELGSDNYYVSDTNYQSVTPLERKAYVWSAQVFAGEPILDWDYPYRSVFYA